MTASWWESYGKPRQCVESRNITLWTKVHIVKAMVFPMVTYSCESWTIKKAEHWRIGALKCGAEEDSWESLRQQRDQSSQSYGKSTLNTHKKDWCWSWNSNTLVIWCEQTWCWKRFRAEGRKGIRGCDGWTAPAMQWTWTLANFRRRWRTYTPGVLQSMGLQRVWHDWATEPQQQQTNDDPSTYFLVESFYVLLWH